MKRPGPDHPISISPTVGRVVVKLAGRTIADSRNSLTLKESTYRDVYYLPRSDVDMTLLLPAVHSSYCPYKGDAGHFTVSTGDAASQNAAWTYETPDETVAEIKERLAFYPDRVDSIELIP